MQGVAGRITLGRGIARDHRVLRDPESFYNGPRDGDLVNLHSRLAVRIAGSRLIDDGG